MPEPLPEPLSEPSIRIRLRSPAEIAAAVPHLVGFRPERSLVVIALQGPRSQIALTMRFDLPPARYDALIAREVAARVAHVQADSAVVVCYPGRATVAALPRRPLVTAIDRHLGGRGVTLTDALCVREDRYRSYLCTDPACCPPSGRPLATADDTPAVTDLVAARALTGRAALPDRAALVASVAPIGGPAVAATAVELDRVLSEVAADIGRLGFAAVREATIEIVQRLVERYADPARARLHAAEAARVAAGMLDVHARDAVLADLSGAQLETGIALFTAVCRLIPPPDDAPVCSVLGWLAYAAGNGALANVALDRALASDPDYSLAGLLVEGLARQVPPALMCDTWRRCRAGESGLPGLA